MDEDVVVRALEGRGNVKQFVNLTTISRLELQRDELLHCHYCKEQLFFGPNVEVIDAARFDCSSIIPKNRYSLRNTVPLFWWNPFLRLFCGLRPVAGHLSLVHCYEATTKVSWIPMQQQ